MISLNTNFSSLIAQSSLKNSTNILNQAVERMTTGYKINHAKDNAANYSIATNMTTKMSALQVAEDNVLQGLDMINTASESLSLIENKLQRLRALATQASNDTYGTQSKQAINAEAGALVDEISRIYSTVEYDKTNLFAESESLQFILSIKRRDTTNMTTLSSVNRNTVIQEGTYSITTPEELEQLSDMSGRGLIGSDCEFVLANNIDMISCANFTPIDKFSGIFDGNGYEIKHLNIESTEKFIGLFTILNTGSEIKNLAISGNVKSQNSVGMIAGGLLGGKISNCYTSGMVNAVESAAGSVIGEFFSYNGVITDCYSTCTVLAGTRAGGIVGSAFVHLENNELVIQNCFFNGIVEATNGFRCGGILGEGGCTTPNINSTVVIKNCYSQGEIIGSSFCGEIVGTTYKLSIENCYATKKAMVGRAYDGQLTIKDSYALNTSSRKGIFVDDVYTGLSAFVELKNCYYNPEITSTNSYIAGYDNSVYANSGIGLCTNQAPFEHTLSSNIYSNIINKQFFVGINGEKNDIMNVNLGVSLVDLFNLKNIDLNNGKYLNDLDKVLSIVSTKQTEYGAVQNRLESALDEIATQYENLASSRSTICNADLAKESATYIQQQILQQAAATLLATANQSPAIALQLI